jgi:hypothetical protein
MSTIDESSFDGLDRAFFDLSSKFEEPLYWAYGLLRHRLVSVLEPNRFDNASSKTREIAYRVWIATCAAIAFAGAGLHLLAGAVALKATSKMLHVVGRALQKEGYTHGRGNAPEKRLENGQINVMTWNIRGQRTGLHYVNGGVVHWRSRIDAIVEKIRQEDPDVLVLQEVHDSALAKALTEKLADQFAHFYTHFTGGGMVLTKCSVDGFQFTPFSNGCRGFETLEIKASSDSPSPCIRIIGTHLPSGIEENKKCMVEIVDALEKRETTLPTLFVGNVTVDEDLTDEATFLSEYVHHGYRRIEPTHTGHLAAQWRGTDGKNAVDDFISLFKRNLSEGRALPVIEKGIRLDDCHLIKGFDETYNTKEALSDHHAVVAKISGLRT